MRKPVPQYGSRKPRANYGANEQPRQCECGSTATTIVKNYATKDIIHRKRQCRECGNIFKTIEKIVH